MFQCNLTLLSLPTCKVFGGLISFTSGLVNFTLFGFLFSTVLGLVGCESISLRADHSSLSLNRSAIAERRCNNAYGQLILIFNYKDKTEKGLKRLVLYGLFHCGQLFCTLDVELQVLLIEYKTNNVISMDRFGQVQTCPVRFYLHPVFIIQFRLQ